jgi:hypothetical protein
VRLCGSSGAGQWLRQQFENDMGAELRTCTKEIRGGIWIGVTRTSPGIVMAP